MEIVLNPTISNPFLVFVGDFLWRVCQLPHCCCGLRWHIQPAGATTLPIQKTFSWNVDVNKPCQYVTCLILGAFITKIKGLFMSGCLEFQSGYPKFLDFRPQISVGLEMSRNLDEKKKRLHFLCLAPSLEGAGNGSQRFFWFCKECGLFIGLLFLFWT